MEADYLSLTLVAFVSMMLGVIFGYVLRSALYNMVKPDGVISVERNAEGIKTYSLELALDPDTIESMTNITFQVKS